MTKLKKETSGGDVLAVGGGPFLARPSGQVRPLPIQVANLVGDKGDLDRWEMDGGEFNQPTETGLIACTDTALTIQDYVQGSKGERRGTVEPITVCFGLSRLNEPLVIFEKSPLSSFDMELGPQQIRDIAAVLVEIADESEALGLNPGELRRSYPIGK